MPDNYRPPSGVAILIEQAVAAGDTVERICARLDVDQELVDAVMANMDLALVQPDSATRGRPYRHRDVAPCGTRAGYERHRSHGERPCGPCGAAAWPTPGPHACGECPRTFGTERGLEVHQGMAHPATLAAAS